MKRTFFAVGMIALAVGLTGCQESTKQITLPQSPQGNNQNFQTSSEQPAPPQFYSNNTASSNQGFAVVQPDNTYSTSAQNSGNTYTIRRGDTLWSIAESQLGDGQKWRDIVAANPGLNPHELAVGQTINLP